MSNVRKTEFNFIKGFKTETIMASGKVLSFEPDSLFEQHNISEIDQIHKKLQNDIERKKEELRTNVG